MQHLLAASEKKKKLSRRQKASREQGIKITLSNLMLADCINSYLRLSCSKDTVIVLVMCYCRQL